MHNRPEIHLLIFDSDFSSTQNANFDRRKLDGKYQKFFKWKASMTPATIWSVTVAINAVTSMLWNFIVILPTFSKIMNPHDPHQSTMVYAQSAWIIDTFAYCIINYTWTVRKTVKMINRESEFSDESFKIPHPNLTNPNGHVSQTVYSTEYLLRIINCPNRIKCAKLAVICSGLVDFIHVGMHLGHILPSQYKHLCTSMPSWIELIQTFAHGIIISKVKW